MNVNEDELKEFLQENGPESKRNLRDITNRPPRRYDGVNELRINPSHSSGSSVSSSGTPITIAYLDDHSPRDVLAVWSDYHQHMIDQVSADAIYRATPDEFREAMKEIVDVEGYYSGRGGDNSGGSEICDLCGEPY